MNLSSLSTELTLKGLPIDKRFIVTGRTRVLLRRHLRQFVTNLPEAKADSALGEQSIDADASGAGEEKKRAKRREKKKKKKQSKSRIDGVVDTTDTDVLDALSEAELRELHALCSDHPVLSRMWNYLCLPNDDASSDSLPNNARDLS